MKNRLIVTIDGPAASGKGTLSENLAALVDYNYFATGNLYRAIAKTIRNNKIDYRNIKSIQKFLKNINYKNLDFEDLANDEIAAIASNIASFDEVRKPLVSIQRDHINSSNKGMIVEGRDIGSVIYPQADVKFYLTADVNIRAERRYNQLQKRGIQVIYDDILSDLIIRDERDINRNSSPLVEPVDSIKIDSTSKSVEEITQFCVSIIKKREYS